MKTKIARIVKFKILIIIYRIENERFSIFISLFSTDSRRRTCVKEKDRKPFVLFEHSVLPDGILNSILSLETLGIFETSAK